MADEKDVEKTIAEDLVVTKYKMAGDIVNRELNPIPIFPNLHFHMFYSIFRIIDPYGFRYRNFLRAMWVSLILPRGDK